MRQKREKESIKGEGAAKETISPFLMPTIQLRYRVAATMYFIAVASHFTWQRVSRTLEVFGKEMFPEKGHEVEKVEGW